MKRSKTLRNGERQERSGTLRNGERQERSERSGTVNGQERERSETIILYKITVRNVHEITVTVRSRYGHAHASKTKETL
jgi:hypothetical protein